MRYFRFSLAALTLVVLSSSWAAEPRSLSFGLNVLSHGLNRVSHNPSADTSLMGTTYYNLDFQLHVPTSWQFLWSPRLIWMPDFLLPTKAPGSTVKTSFLILGSPITYAVNSSLDVSGGPALVSYQIHGPGGTTTLDNGNGTSSFALPGNTQTPRTVGLLLGTGYNSGNWRFTGDLLTESLGSAEKRTFSLMLAVAYSLYRY